MNSRANRANRLRAPFVQVVVRAATIAAMTAPLSCAGDADVAHALDDASPDASPDAGDASSDARADADSDAADQRPDVSYAPLPSHGSPAPRPLEGTVGDPCTRDDECSPTKTGANFCSNDGSFSYGTLYPTPVCLGRTCDAVSGEAITRCDGGHGICVENTTVAAVCLPSCTFDGSGAPPRGCLGKDACIALGLEAGIGIGYCFGGCIEDADCTAGDECQRDLGFCVRSLFARTTSFGLACTAGSNPPEVECNCLYPATKSPFGYCTQFCRVGDARSACPSGYRCSAQVPATFGSEPLSMGGSCLKQCFDDDDCAPINAHCDDTLAGGAVCVPGARESH